MARANQLAGIAATRAARAKLRQAEQALLEAHVRVTEARTAFESALARGAQDDAERARLEFAASEVARDRAEAAHATAAQEREKGTATALGEGAGFELLSSRHPLLLLPVRLETRFAWRDADDRLTYARIEGQSPALLVRIYPDDVHDDAHEPELTRVEEELRLRLEKRLRQATDLRDLDAAWSEVIGHVGPTRASWLGELIVRGAPPGLRVGPLSRSSVARLLPDRWVAVAELPDGSTRTGQSEPVREPLETGPSPDRMDWMIDFQAALKAGMAIVIEQLPADLEEVRRLIVVGARGTLDPAEAADELEQLLDAQHYTRGLSFLSPGAPTNSLPGARAAYSSRPPLADLLPVERRRFAVWIPVQPLCQPGDDSAGTNLAYALGIPSSTFAYVRGANATDERDGQRIRELLVTATRPQLARMLNGIMGETLLDEVLSYGSTFASATGNLPTLRIGTQPYGILPVLVRDNKPPPAGSLPARILPVLDRLRAAWDTAVGNLHWVGKPGSDPGETLVRILQQDAVARRIAFRPLVGQQLAAKVEATLSRGSPLARERAAAAQAIDALGATNALASPLIAALHLNFASSLRAPLVEPADAAQTSPQRAANYLEIVAALRPDFLLRHDYGGAERPRSLLFSIARLALLARADAAARAAHLAANADSDRWDDEEVPTVFVDPLGTPLRRLEAPDPLDLLEPIAFHLSEQGRDAGILSGIRETLRALKNQPPETLEQLVRASLGLFSHRLDPWYTAFAFERLLELRNDVASMTGLGVGGYGVVEHIAPSPRQPVAGSTDLFRNPFNGGYVHAPSVNHGATAAVLRSVHLAHAHAGHAEAFSVDLSSQRVRRGLELFEGIRQGQPLAALLGYAIERQLTAEGLQRFVASFRAAAPLIANTLTPSHDPAEAVAATNVVDGLTLLADAGYDGEETPTAAALWGKHPSLRSPGDEDALNRVLAAARDALDAAADLAVAESVYQTVQGNPARAGGTVDGLSGAPVPPPEIGVVRTPRTGVGVTHRLLVLLTDPVASDWVSSPRALAEPRLEALARAVLPTPANIGVRARFVDAQGAEVAALDQQTLQSLQHAANTAQAAGRGDLRFGALDLVAMADPHETPHRSALELRLTAMFELLRPANAAEATLEFVYDRHPTWDAQRLGLLETLEIARQLRDLISRARPLAPADLVAPAAPPATINSGELAQRAAQATTTLSGAITTLDAAHTSTDTTQIRDALFGADAIGVAGAAPTTVVDTAGTTPAARTEHARELTDLHGQIDATLNELRKRLDAALSLPAADSAGRLKAIFGESFAVLPTFTSAADVTGAFDAAVLPDGATATAARTWLSRAARVRAPAGALDAALAYADAVAEADSTRPFSTLHATQIGGATGERWVALPPATGTQIPGGRVSLVAATVDGGLPTGTVAGLLVDEWVEVVPSPEETTSVAFHYEAPSATAPQVWLLGVPPFGFERWRETDAVQIVEEALELARIRLVGLDDVSGLGQLLPAFVTGENPQGDTIGLDVEVLTEP